MVENMKSERMLLIFSGASSSSNMNQDQTINIKTKLNSSMVLKRYINTLMNLTGAPAHCSILCLLYVCSLLNATATPGLGGFTPIQHLTGKVPDISHFLHFSFWEPVYYKVDENEPDHRFPSQSKEKQ